jgi:hypothetical protein
MFSSAVSTIGMMAQLWMSNQKWQGRRQLWSQPFTVKQVHPVQSSQSLLQITRSPNHFGGTQTMIQPSQATNTWIGSRTDKPIGQHITNKIPDRSRSQNRYMLLLTHSWHLHNTSYSCRNGETWISKPKHETQFLCKASVRILRRMFKPSTDFIQFPFCEFAEFHGIVRNRNICM